jgi:hypothetical protein
MLTMHAVAILALSASVPQIELLDFRADWCGPCRSMDPAVRQLQAKHYPVRAVNVDQERPLAERFHIDRIPCFVLVIDGKEVERQQGPCGVERLAKMCQDASHTVTQQLAAASRARTPAATSVAGGHAAAPAVAWTPEAANAQDAALLAATVRIRVEDPDGHSCGSGTIIDARDGEALILTCAHLFRDSKGKGKIEVDLFGPTPASAVPAKLRSFDVTRDVGLISIRAPGALMVAHLAPSGYSLRKDEATTSVGCSHGERPTVMHSRISTMDKFLGPPNLEVAGQPVEGRSGGGLFNAAGQVIGVCNCADPSDHEGIYAALASLYGELDHAGLARLYRPDAPAAVAPANPEILLATAETPVAPSARAARLDVSRAPDAPQTLAPLVPVSRRVMTPSGDGTLSASEQQAIEEIRHHVREGSVSPAFLKELANVASEPAAAPAKTASAPKPILEWDADRGWLHRESLPATP